MICPIKFFYTTLGISLLSCTERWSRFSISTHPCPLDPVSSPPRDSLPKGTVGRRCERRSSWPLWRLKELETRAKVPFLHQDSSDRVRCVNTDPQLTGHFERFNHGRFPFTIVQWKPSFSLSSLSVTYIIREYISLLLTYNREGPVLRRSTFKIYVFFECNLFYTSHNILIETGSSISRLKSSCIIKILLKPEMKEILLLWWTILNG